MNLNPRYSGRGSIESVEDGSRLHIPPGPAGRYRLSQLDDHFSLPKRELPWRVPVSFSLQARVSAKDIPGTWGFGFWNNPFGIGFGISGRNAVLPALPNAAWFFHASDNNYLSFRDDLPGSGFLAASFRSLRLPSLALLPGFTALPFLALPPFARQMRKLLRRFIREDNTRLDLDVTGWHSYQLDWGQDGVTWWVDGEIRFKTSNSPTGPLGFILWIDNQYAAFTPKGRLRAGTLENDRDSWLEIRHLECKGR